MLIGCNTPPISVSVLPPKPAVLPVLTQIKNFDVVSEPHNILRGGQPTSEQFKLLKAQGITTILKLNEDSEGSDGEAELLGLTVVDIPVSMKEQLFGPVPTDAIRAFWVTHTDNVYVHCEHGQDRTGVACYLYNVRHGMAKQAAIDDMLSHGFHKILFGLWDSVK